MQATMDPSSGQYLSIEHPGMDPSAHPTHCLSIPVFPASALPVAIYLYQDGLVKNNMAKLTFYALSNPQKLDRIGEYLSKRLSRDLIRNRIK